MLSLSFCGPVSLSFWLFVGSLGVEMFDSLVDGTGRSSGRSVGFSFIDRVSCSYLDKTKTNVI